VVVGGDDPTRDRSPLSTTVCELSIIATGRAALGPPSQGDTELRATLLVFGPSGVAIPQPRRAAREPRPGPTSTASKGDAFIDLGVSVARLCPGASEIDGTVWDDRSTSSRGTTLGIAARACCELNHAMYADVKRLES